METDPTQMSIVGEQHPSLAELKDPVRPGVAKHLAACAMCRSVVDADDELGDPIPLDLPKGLVSENAFKWPANAMARGGMAQIFAGEDRRLGRTVILKAPREGDELPAGMAELFQRRVTAEARILAKLQHPSIVTIYELGKSTVGWPFCVLERVDGVALRDRLDELADAERREGKPRTRDRLELLSNLVGIAEALAYAHERRVVHRDCTPNNILLGKRGEATLIDWGIARDLDAPGASGTDAKLDGSEAASERGVTISAGTPPYLPLEQTQGRAASPSFDVYSFGVTLYEVIAGRTPFEWRPADGPGDRTRQITAFLDWLKSREPVAPAMPKDRELSGIIARAMAPDAADRFTADELVRALKQYLTGELVFSHRYSLTGRLARWARRNRAVTVAIGAVVAFAIVAAFEWVHVARVGRDAAEARAAAAAANQEASEKSADAADALREAEAANALADKAQQEGKNADALRAEADAKRRAADAKRRDAETAAQRARGTADDALKAQTEALKLKDEADHQRDAAATAQADAERQRDAARTAQGAAERERDSARTVEAAAERERDAAKQTATAAEADRDAARSGQARAETDRDAARTAEAAAERERDSVIAARAAAEKERDEARRKLAELEARQRDRRGGDAPRDDGAGGERSRGEPSRAPNGADPPGRTPGGGDQPITHP